MPARVRVTWEEEVRSGSVLEEGRVTVSWVMGRGAPHTSGGRGRGGNLGPSKGGGAGRGLSQEPQGWRGGPTLWMVKASGSVLLL